MLEQRDRSYLWKGTFLGVVFRQSTLDEWRRFSKPNLHWVALETDDNEQFSDDDVDATEVTETEQALRDRAMPLSQNPPQGKSRKQNVLDLRNGTRQCEHDRSEILGEFSNRPNSQLPEPQSMAKKLMSSRCSG